MTAPLLLGYICSALLVQFFAFTAIVVWSSRRAGARQHASVRATPYSAPEPAWSGWRAFRVTRRDYEDAARTQCSFYLEPVDGFALPPFKPGQFLTISMKPSKVTGGEAREPRNIVRCYSLSDRPNSTQYRITIKRALGPVARPDLPPGVASTTFHDTVQVGEVLQVKAPAGQFSIDPDPHVPVVLIAGGIGITPMMSMILWSLVACPGRAIHLYYGVRDGAEQAFKAVLESLARSNPNFHLTVVYAKPASDDALGRDFHHAGYVSVDLVRRTLPHGRYRFYVCGPPAMMKSVIFGLREWGIPSPDIRQEAFGPSSVGTQPGQSAEQATSRANIFEITFVRSRRTIAWDGKDLNLLDFAERHGVAVDSGCRSGNCGTCETRLISGTVRYAQRPDYDLSSGSCLLCVGTPDSALALEA